MGHYKEMDIEIQNRLNSHVEWFFIRLEERIDTLCNHVQFLNDAWDRQVYLALIERLYEFYGTMQIFTKGEE